MSDAVVDGAIAPPRYASRKAVVSWVFFDWAAQPFFTVVTTFIFGPYFVSRMASDPAAGQAPEQEAVHRAKAQFATLGAFTGAGHLLENPAQFGGGKIRIDQQPGLGGHRGDQRSPRRIQSYFRPSPVQYAV